MAGATIDKLDGRSVICSSPTSFAKRLSTFHGHWDDDQATARQLAAVGHVYDRPPLEALVQGSRCVDCSHFLTREQSICLLDDNGANSTGIDADDIELHEPGCQRLQVRLPRYEQEECLDLTNNYLSRRSWFEDRSRNGTTARPSRSKSPLVRASFFDLPAELRLHIYSMVLPVHEGEVRIEHLDRASTRIASRDSSVGRVKRDPTRVNMLRTCRRIYNDAHDLLFAKTTFVCSSSWILYLFLRNIGRSGRRALRSINVRALRREDAVAFALLGSCENLVSLTIGIPRPRLLIPRSPIWMMDGMAALLDISGLEKVKIEPWIKGMRTSMTIDDADAIALVRELTRPRGTPGSVRLVDGVLKVSAPSPPREKPRKPPLVMR